MEAFENIDPLLFSSLPPEDISQHRPTPKHSSHDASRYQVSRSLHGIESETNERHDQYSSIPTPPFLGQEAHPLSSTKAVQTTQTKSSDMNHASSSFHPFDLLSVFATDTSTNHLFNTEPFMMQHSLTDVRTFEEFQNTLSSEANSQRLFHFGGHSMEDDHSFLFATPFREPGELPPSALAAEPIREDLDNRTVPVIPSTSHSETHLPAEVTLPLRSKRANRKRSAANMGSESNDAPTRPKRVRLWEPMGLPTFATPVMAAEGKAATLKDAQIAWRIGESSCGHPACVTFEDGKLGTEAPLVRSSPPLPPPEDDERTISGDEIAVPSYRDQLLAKGGRPRMFMTRANLMKHLLTHIEARPFICPAEGCDQAFKQKWLLDRHSKVHLEHSLKTTFSCTFTGCKVSCSSQYNLSNHLLTHSEEKRFNCTFDGCDRSFATQRNLRLHEPTHTGEKPHGCSHPGCSMRYYRLSHLKRHQEVHLETDGPICLSGDDGDSTGKNENEPLETRADGPGDGMKAEKIKEEKEAIIAKSRKIPTRRRKKRRWKRQSVDDSEESMDEEAGVVAK